jgi:acetylornithine deacetylase/succinyl-diaminopimelate desuccinylase-like protein
MAWLAQEGMLTADAGVATEPSSLGTESWESLFIAQRGSSVWSLAARGEPGHSAAQVPHERRASWAFARALTALLDAPLFEEHVHPVDETRSTVNVATMVGGGIVPFAHPEALLATIEVRTIEGMTKELVREELERCVRDAGLGDRVSVEAAPPPLDWLPPGETVRDERLLVAAKGAWRAVLASEPRLRVLPAGTDSSYLQAAGIPALPAFGPGSLAVAHRPNEWIPELDLIRAIDLFETLVHRYHRGGEGEVD